ncbi:hypothetical protein BDB00DRAFT_116193 [Zychaea mexicana]|uniref:uncharacterized protein n=1 Tax=Zychaea mexicana TaxID=64656 RepID=UPI0022FDFAEE|nr:uncharacterized protein BDB00DRAFT_116193 [Zychaea mexicana]KAI9484712.1 hypothetical protein BDB00DRAFT_116193 [Zychaea mexicana]
MSSRIRQGKRQRTTTYLKVSERETKLIKVSRSVAATTGNYNTMPFEVRQTQSSNVDSAPSQWVDTDNDDDDVCDQPKRKSAAAKRAVRWVCLFPGLLKAYKEGYKQAPVAEALEPIDAAICSCNDDKKASREVTCIFKYGIRQFTIIYCKACPNFSLPLDLMRRHMLPLTPINPGHAVHINIS